MRYAGGATPPGLTTSCYLAALAALIALTEVRPRPFFALTSGQLIVVLAAVRVE
jgi:hypothetical protein